MNIRRRSRLLYYSKKILLKSKVKVFIFRTYVLLLPKIERKIFVEYST